MKQISNDLSYAKIPLLSLCTCHYDTASVPPRPAMFVEKLLAYTLIKCWNSTEVWNCRDSGAILGRHKRLYSLYFQFNLHYSWSAFEIWVLNEARHARYIPIISTPPTKETSI